MLAAPIVVFGTCDLELQSSRPGQWRIACSSESLDVCLYLNRLGLRCAYLTVLGNDELSSDLKSSWRSHGIDTALILTDENRMPEIRAILENGPAGLTRWTTQQRPACLASLPGWNAIVATARNAKLFYLSLPSVANLSHEDTEQLARLLSEIRLAGGAVCIDPYHGIGKLVDLQKAARSIPLLLPHASLVLARADEVRRLHPFANIQDIYRFLRVADGVEVVLREEAGVWVGRDEMQMACFPCAPATMASDAFNAAYVASRWIGRPPVDAAKLATDASVKVIRFPVGIVAASHVPTFAVPAEIGGDCA